ncbi:hypothetical protein AB0C93_11210 [Streptomyces sp. NPDC048518]|uniref:hypothetical protein n=1 Tax=Streptomyces sp. NPDC048518 TaxID=3155029 RepID=UPI00340EF613
MTRPDAAIEDGSGPGPFTQTPPTAVYEMRMLRSAAEREEAAALVQDHQDVPMRHGALAPARADIPAHFRDARNSSAGLFEDGILLACMIPDRNPDLGWGEGPCLFLRSVHALPGKSVDITPMITLWASDFAARLGLPCVRAEVTTGLGYAREPRADFCHRLINCGWDLCGSGKGRDGNRSVRLELLAECRPGLHALISCRVHLPEPVSHDRSSA